MEPRRRLKGASFKVRQAGLRWRDSPPFELVDGASRTIIRALHHHRNICALFELTTSLKCGDVWAHTRLSVSSGGAWSSRRSAQRVIAAAELWCGGCAGTLTENAIEFEKGSSGGAASSSKAEGTGRDARGRD